MILDATTVIWYANQLRLHEAASYKRKTPALTARDVFPIDSQQNPYAKSIAFMSMDELGEAGWLADNALDAPAGDVAASETAYNVGMIATKWDVSNYDIIAAQKLGVDLDARQVTAAFDRVNRLINTSMFEGNTARNIPGLFSDSDVSTAEATNGDWVANNSADNCLADIAEAYANHQSGCNGAHEVTDILLPIAVYNWMATKRLGTTSEMTVLQWIAQNLPFLAGGVNSIHKVPECYRSASNSVMVMYNKSDECMQGKIPQEIAFSEPMPLGLGHRIYCYARSGGLHIHYPKSVYIATDI